MPNSFTLTWSIDNYSKLALEVNECIKSPVFVTDQGKQKWNLELYANGDQPDPDDISCFLRKTEGIGMVFADCTFQLLSPEGNSFISQKLSAKVFQTNDYWGRTLTQIEQLKKEMKEWNADVLTVQCEVHIKSSNLNPSSDLKAKSEIGFNRNTFVWSVKVPDSQEWSQRQIFSCSQNISLETILTITEDDILIQLKNISNFDMGYQSVTCKISVIDVTNVKILSIEDTYSFDGTKDNNSWKFPIFITKKTLEERNCIENGFFTVIFDFSVPNGIITKQFNDSIEYEIKPHVKIKQNVDVVAILQNDLEQMLLNKKHSDVNITAGGQLFCAHKCLLSSRSPVFRAMFDSEMLENQTNVVDITDCDSITMDSLLKFLYTGIMDGSNYETTLKLMLAADKYQIESLTDMCADILINILSPENVFSIIKIADLVKHKSLREAALHLIKENATDILSSAEWLQWSKQNLQLAFEISSELAMQYALKIQFCNRK